MRIWICTILFILQACHDALVNDSAETSLSAADLLGNISYQAISYGGYRSKTRDTVPTIQQIKEDLRILAAMNIKVLRTYNVHKKEINHLLEAIRDLKKSEPGFEMYIMLGAWIDCKNAWTATPAIHSEESSQNVKEISEAVRLSNEYQDIIKIIAVGNEAMVKWASAYYVEPQIILKWVNYLQQLKKEGALPKNVWITSSDNFASWGGGGQEYHVPALEQLIKAVDFISVHTYPMHDTHYNPAFWGIKPGEATLADRDKVDAVMFRARDYAIAQYRQVEAYMKSLGVNKPIHIGETGWSTVCNSLYGASGSKAVDEYKSASYYHLMREWTNNMGISLFYFEAFDEQWKDPGNAMGSENHFGLFNLQGQAKYAIWNIVDSGKFDNLTRDGKPITKTYSGDFDVLWKDVAMPELMKSK
jgi:exo-beta-1,3-glucanase (GH17 family)